MRNQLLFLLMTAGCADGDSKADTASPAGATAGPCAYPASVVDPMSLAGVMPAFSWPSARSMVDGAKSAIDLTTAHCASDVDIDWSPFDVLLFVSIPAW